jgi:hypothetical protein
MRKIYVAFYKKDAPHADWTDKLIAWWTKGEFSHVELVIDNYMYSTSPRDGKVRCKFHKFDEKTWYYKDLEITEDAYKRFIEFFNLTEGLKYDWWGIFGFILPFADREDRYFCSEWVTKALIILGITKVFLLEPSKTSPNKLERTL